MGLVCLPRKQTTKNNPKNTGTQTLIQCPGHRTEHHMFKETKATSHFRKPPSLPPPFPLFFLASCLALASSSPPRTQPLTHIHTTHRPSLLLSSAHNSRRAASPVLETRLIEKTASPRQATIMASASPPSLPHIDALLAREDDSKTPYASKYEARGLLQAYLAEKGAEIEPLMDARIAYRLGKIGTSGGGGRESVGLRLG